MPEFVHSDFKKSGAAPVIWTTETLKKFMAKIEGMVDTKLTRMPVVEVHFRDDRGFRQLRHFVFYGIDQENFEKFYAAELNQLKKHFTYYVEGCPFDLSLEFIEYSTLQRIADLARSAEIDTSQNSGISIDPKNCMYFFVSQE
eukprot:Platyproteum_vivax@DN4586_c0_g1_i1.p1